MNVRSLNGEIAYLQGSTRDTERSTVGRRCHVAWHASRASLQLRQVPRPRHAKQRHSHKQTLNAPSRSWWSCSWWWELLALVHRAKGKGGRALCASESEGRNAGRREILAGNSPYSSSEELAGKQTSTTSSSHSHTSKDSSRSTLVGEPRSLLWWLARTSIAHTPHQVVVSSSSHESYAKKEGQLQGPDLATDLECADRKRWRVIVIVIVVVEQL